MDLDFHEIPCTINAANIYLLVFFYELLRHGIQQSLITLDNESIVV